MANQHKFNRSSAAKSKEVPEATARVLSQSAINHRMELIFMQIDSPQNPFPLPISVGEESLSNGLAKALELWEQGHEAGRSGNLEGALERYSQATYHDSRAVQNLPKLKSIVLQAMELGHADVYTLSLCAFGIAALDHDFNSALDLLKGCIKQPPQSAFLYDLRGSTYS